MARLEVLRPFVEQTVAQYLGIEKVQVADDGTIPIRAGSTVVNVRLVEGQGDKPVLQVYSPLLRDIKSTPELLTKLNEMNQQLSFTRAFWVEDQVILAMELLAETLDKEQVGHACSYVSLAADFWDETLKNRFGGELYFNEPAPTAEVSGTQSPTPPTTPADPAADGSQEEEGSSHGGYI